MRCRTLIAQCGVPAFPIVKHLNVVKQITLGLLPCCVMLVEHTFVLQAVEEALHRCVIPAVTLAAHAGHHAVGSEQILIVVTAVLAATIRVVQEAGLGTAPEPRHAQRTDHELFGHTCVHRPAHNHACVQIHHHRQIQPAFAGRDIRDIDRPGLIRRRRLELPVKKVRGHRQIMLRVRRRFPPVSG